MNHPLKVYYPFGDIHYLLHWWTHNRQDQVAIARSERSLQLIFKNICNEYDDARIKQLLEVEIVSPSNKMCEEASKAAEAENIKNFVQTVAHSLKDLVRIGKTLPSQFRLCTFYMNKYQENDDESPDSVELKYHFDCKNCHDGIVLVDDSLESFYQKYSQQWEQYFPTKQRGDKNLKYSQARQLQETEPFWVARIGSSFSSGVECVQPDVQPENVTGSVLFYFVLRRELNLSLWKEQLTIIKQKRKQEKEKERLGWQKCREQEKIEEARKVLSIFNS